MRYRGTWVRFVVLLGFVVCLVSGLASAAGTTVSGTVSGSDQGFLPDAVVVIDGAARRETKTDADGRFTFSDVAPGRYRITVSAEAYLPIERQMEVGTAPVSMDVVLLRLPGL